MSPFLSFFHLARVEIEQREAAIADLVGFLSLPANDSIKQVVDAWPTVHKRKSDEDRAFKLTYEEREQALTRINGLLGVMKVLGEPQQASGDQLH